MTKARKRLRWALWCAAAAVAVAVAHSREFVLVPYCAMPDSCVVASDNYSIRSRWRDVVALPAISNLLEALDVDVAELRDAPGWRILIPLTTGENTILALTPSGEGREEPVLWGASHSGWRRLVLLFMLKTRWIPGLGRLDIAEGGSRYLQLGSERHPSDWKVGFSIRRNVLLAALSTDGDAVRELEERIDSGAAPAQVFGGREPWKDRKRPLHRFWLRDDTICSYPQIDIDDISREGFSASFSATLDGHASELVGSAEPLTGRNAKASQLAADKAFLAISLPGTRTAAWLKNTLHIEHPLNMSAKGEDAMLYLCGAPYGGSIFGLRIPSATLLCPGLVLGPEDVTRAAAMIAGGNKYPQVQTPIDEGASVLVPLRWQKGNAILKTFPDENGVVELDRRRHGLTFCSSMASFRAQRASKPTTDSHQEAWQSQVRGVPEGFVPICGLWIDMKGFAEEARKLLALSQIATLTGVVNLTPDMRQTVTAADRVLATLNSPSSLSVLVSRSDDGTRVLGRITGGK